MELTIRINPCDYEIINLNWSDHNNVEQQAVIEMSLSDKPRILSVSINGVVVATVPSKCIRYDKWKKRNEHPAD